MKKINHLLFFGCIVLISHSALAQIEKTSESADKKNIFKVNLTSLAFKNFSTQYERIVRRKMSVALGVSIMPKAPLPFGNTIKKTFADNADAQRAVESTRLGNFSITPEVRFYLGRKGAPKGFYVAPFARYNHMTLQQVYDFTASDGKVYHPLIKGSLNNIGGGILFGTQFILGKSITLDWWIAGPLAGSTNGSFTGTENMSSMSAADKQKLKEDIESVNIPLTKISATVGNNQVDVKLSGPYAGIRAFGFALGFRF